MIITIELARKALIQMGMKPNHFGKMGRKKVEFITYPWTAGREIFILVQKPNQPGTVECVGADEVTVMKGVKN